MQMLTRPWLGIALAVVTLALPLCAQPADRDGDGLTDKQEQALGSDPNAPDKFQLIINDGLESEKRRGQPTYDASKDLLTLEFAHAGGDRYLWRATFADDFKPQGSVFHLYIDADSNKATGRKGYGVEYMVSVVNGGACSQHYDAEGNRTAGPMVCFVADGKVLIISADLDLGRDDKGVCFAINPLCHTAVKRPPMSDSCSQVKLAGLPVVDRPKIKRIVDYTESEGTEGSFGIDIVRKTLKRKDVVVVPYDKLGMEGFKVDIFTYRRYGHVRKTSRTGKVWTAAPKAGRYHVGFVMFDDSSDERVAIKINDQLRGIVFANADNNRWWTYWLKQPYDFKGGERVELVGFGPSGRHGICNILFIPTPPQIRPFRYEVQHMASYTRVGRDGWVTLSWVTTWPCPTKFDYGPTSAYGKTAGSHKPALVHRVVLDGLDPGITYHGRAVGQTRDRAPYYGADFTFSANAPQPPATVAGVRTVPMTVRNPLDVPAAGWPVVSGIPFPEGQLGDCANVRLVRDGQQVPAQITTTARWRDHSVKWVLVRFLADVPAKGEADYQIEFGRDVKPAPAATKLSVVKADDGVRIDTGALQVKIDASGRIVLPSGKACGTTLVDAKGKTYSMQGAKAELTVEEAGPIRAVVKTVADLVASDGSKSYRIEKRVMAYANAPYLRVFHTFVVKSEAEFTEIEAMRFVVPAASKSWQVALADGKALTLDASTRLVRQRFDREFVTAAAGREKPTKGRIVGRIVSRGAEGCAVAVRDAWQNYPKGFSLGDGVLNVGLCPDFEAGLYDKFPFEKQGHHLYYYLLNGHYKFKRGMAKTHELFLCFAPQAQREGLCKLFQRPLLGTADPKWYCASKALYDVAPRDMSKFKAYEEAIDKNLKRYVGRREGQHDYGLMNYGDWYGERGVNWGNVEYDTQHAFILEYIRSGNPDAFFLADQTEIHNRDIDTIHWSDDPLHVGFVYVHQMCHVGGYYKKKVPGTLGIPRAGASVTHAWCEGHFDHYFLTGDRRSFDTGKAVADFFIRKELGRPYYFLSCRAPGWQLMQTAIAYASTNDPYYLNASRVIVDRVLFVQDTEPRPLPDYQREPGRTHQMGGWSHMMLPGHCRCIPRHRGNAGFMVAVLMSGLKYFHDVTGDPRVKRSIIMGAHYLLDETYSDETQGFRYTSCPNTRYRRGASPLMVEGVARAYRWTRDERFKRVLTEALPASARGSGYGKGFSMYYRVGPRVLADLEACGLTLNEISKAKLVPFKKPGWMSKLKPDQLVVIQAEDFTGQGVGTCQIRDDRQAVWGKMITYWHQDIGHWIEWTVDAPASGQYVVRFRYATSSKNTRRDFRIDGVVPCDAAKSIAFESTGGFGYSPLDWKYRSLTDRGGKEAPLALTKGKHTIRMANLNDGLGLDFIALVRVK